MSAPCPWCRGTGLRWYVSWTDPDDVEKCLCGCDAGDAKEAADAS